MDGIWSISSEWRLIEWRLTGTIRRNIGADLTGPDHLSCVCVLFLSLLKTIVVCINLIWSTGRGYSEMCSYRTIHHFCKANCITAAHKAGTSKPHPMYNLFWAPLFTISHRLAINFKSYLLLPNRTLRCGKNFRGCDNDLISKSKYRQSLTQIMGK